jgi:prepilin-type N-terminal cleavage/methylation domain-containing protein
MVKNILKKPAFTMIELLFAIVIIAISVLPFSTLLDATNTGIENNLIQESIFAASAQLREATTYTWDERSTDDLLIQDLARVVNTTTDGCTVAGNRPGNIDRKCLVDLATTPSNTASVNGNSLDTFAYTTPRSIFVAGATPSATTYKNQYNSTFTIQYCATLGQCIQFGNEATNSNLKQLTFTITDPNNGNAPLVLLRAYSANIGEVEPHRRTLL